jgi:cyanate permease
VFIGLPVVLPALFQSDGTGLPQFDAGRALSSIHVAPSVGPRPGRARQCWWPGIVCVLHWLSMDDTGLLQMTRPSQRERFAYYGWRISAGLAVTTLVSYGVLFYAFGVITKPMEAEFGWSRAQTSIAFSLATLVNGLCAVFAGRVVDRRGGRGMGVFGALLGASLLVAWSNVQSLAGLYVVFALLGLAWSCVFYETAFAVIARWFRRDRTAATFLVTMVAGLASTVFIPLITWLESDHGWRVALRLLAVGLVVITVPIHVLVVRRDPADLGLHVDGISSDLHAAREVESSVTAGAAQRSSLFWRITIAFGIARFLATVMSAHLVPLLIERGRSGAFAAGVAGSVGPMQVLGRVVFLPVSRRVDLRVMTLLTFVVFGAGFTALAVSSSGVGIVAFVILYGTANGMSTLNRAGLVADLFGPAHYGRISGTMAMVGSMLAVAAPFSTGWMRTSSGDYVAVLVGMVVLAAVAALLVLRVGKAPD